MSEPVALASKYNTILITHFEQLKEYNFILKRIQLLETTRFIWWTILTDNVEWKLYTSTPTVLFNIQNDEETAEGGRKQHLNSSTTL